MSFLENLYQNGYTPSEYDRPNTMEYAVASKRVQDLEAKIIEQLGSKFMDDYCYAKASQCTLELAHAYAQGAAFAVRLILDGNSGGR